MLTESSLTRNKEQDCCKVRSNPQNPWGNKNAYVREGEGIRAWVVGAKLLVVRVTTVELARSWWRLELTVNVGLTEEGPGWLRTPNEALLVRESLWRRGEMWLVVPPIDELRCCWVTDFDVFLPGEWADGEISAFVVTPIFSAELGVVFDRTLVPWMVCEIEMVMLV